MGEDRINERSEMRESRGRNVVCSVRNVFGKERAELWQARYDTGWAFGKAGTHSWSCSGGIEDSDRKGGDGENGFFKSFKTEETLFLRNIQAIPAWDACSVQ